MKRFIHSVICIATLASLTVIRSPASAQLSPAEMKAQKDRSARAAAAKKAAERQKAAAADRATTAAKAAQSQAAQLSAAKAYAQQRERLKKNALLAEARRNAAAQGVLTIGYMVGGWAENDPINCQVQDLDVLAKYDFYENGDWTAYEASGKWLVKAGDLVFRYPQYDGDGDPYGDNKVIGYEDKVNVVSKISEHLLIVQVDGGNTVWFRCGENAPMLPDVVMPKNRFPEISYEYYEGGDQWGDYQKISRLWREGRHAEAFRAVRNYELSYPKITYAHSELLNYAGLYLWKHGGSDLKGAAAYFLKNYQFNSGGDRAADSLLSAAEVWKDLGDTSKYCLVMTQFKTDYAFEAKYRLAPRFEIVSRLATCP